MKTNTIICILFSVIALLIISCGGEVIDIPDANRPLFSEGDSFVFKDLYSDISDTMIVIGIIFSYNDHDEDLIEEMGILFRNSIKEENELFIHGYPNGTSIEFLNISNYTGSVDNAMDSFIIDGKEFTKAFKIIPTKEPSLTDELEYFIYDYNYGLLKYKYYEGPEFVLDTVISSALY
jgi:hypothetical protein